MLRTVGLGVVVLRALEPFVPAVAGDRLHTVAEFGLLGVALVATTLLYASLSAAHMEGTILGLKIYIAGPIAAFPILVLVFWLTGLFTLGFDDLGSVDRPPGRQSPERIQAELDELLWKRDRINFHNAQQEKMLDAANAKREDADVVAAGGMAVARRRGVEH